MVKSRVERERELDISYLSTRESSNKAKQRSTQPRRRPGLVPNWVKHQDGRIEQKGWKIGWIYY